MNACIAQVNGPRSGERPIDPMVNSQSLGAEKPNPKAYRGFSERSGVDPDTSIYLGNEYLADNIGSRRAGFTPILCDPQGKEPAVDCTRFTSWEHFADALDDVSGTAREQSTAESAGVPVQRRTGDRRVPEAHSSRTRRVGRRRGPARRPLPYEIVFVDDRQRHRARGARTAGGAGVTTDIPPGVCIGGVPAKPLGDKG